MELASLYKNLTYQDGQPAITVLLNSAAVKEVRIAFRAGQAMKAHKTAFPIVVELVDGLLDFSLDDETHRLEKGMMLSLEADVVHSLQAVADSIVRLSLHKSDRIERVQALVL